MIIKNSDLIGKKKRFVIYFISFVIDIIIITSGVSAVIFAMITPQPYTYFKTFITVALALLSTVSIADIVQILKNKENIAFSLTQKLSNSSNIQSRSLVSLNSTQKSFCETVYGLRHKSNYIYVHGRGNKGKTTAVLCLLDGFAKNSVELNEIPWINNVTYIDCTSDKSAIIDYFLMNDVANTRVGQFSDTLTVVDNIECLGETFFEENVGLFGSYKSFFIIVEDTGDKAPMYLLDKYNRSILISDFNSSTIGIKPLVDLSGKIKSLNHLEIRIFISLYFLLLSSQFANIDDVLPLVKAGNFALRIAINRIEKLNIFIPFPFNKKYYYCQNRQYISLIASIIKDYTEYKEIINSFIQSNVTNPETRWICFINNERDSILNYSEKERLTLFKKSLYNGKYKELYSELNSVISKDSHKQTIFLYERGFLAYYIGNHKESAQVFNELIEKYQTEDKKKEMMLRIIETSHGNPDADNMNMIYSFINTMISQNNFYAICALYWKYHIETEKGIFNYNVFDKIRDKLNEKKKINNTLYKSIVHRSFQDEIRCCHILGIQPSNELVDGYKRFLQTCNRVRNEYYYNLYIEANTLHYVNLIDAVLNESSTENDINSIVYDAQHYYQKALDTSYSDEKSKRATRIKLIDLRLAYVDVDYKDAVNKINQFRIHSQINDVKVHEAFCETLLFKAKALNLLKMNNEITLNNEEMNSLMVHYHKGYQIYEKYGNEYGLKRLDFLLFLLNFIKSDYSNQISQNRIIEMLTKFKMYSKEKHILEQLLEKCKNHTCTQAFVISLIRVYPVILQ